VSVINIVVPPLHRRNFGGGILCVFQYAKGLTARGHDVNILPLLPSPQPLWVDGPYGRLLTNAAARSGPDANRAARASIKNSLRDALTRVSAWGARFLPQEVQRGFHLRTVRERMRQADVTIATSFETALPVHLYGTGRRFYFMQHFEPYFAIDTPEDRWAEHEASSSYRLGLEMIANSSWLRAKIREVTGIEPSLCPNAIDHDVFRALPKPATEGNEIRIISYGGRRASWKGFESMAAAVAATRKRIPDTKIHWSVYGESLLPADNAIASYEPLGFLQPARLADAYRKADILLSAAWYESFPLYPLEAMACGLAVVTTQPGTEEYAIHQQTAEIVEPRNVDSIAHGLTRLIQDRTYREALVRNGLAAAKKFSWDDSVSRMEALLLRDPADRARTRASGEEILHCSRGL
jgi:glycosyltransferase involved in cell wall biosynthesis